MKFLKIGQGMTKLSYMDTKQYLQKDFSILCIANSVQIIEERAFFGFKQIKKVIFEAGSVCTEIGKKAFGKCFELSVIFLPQSLQCIHEQAFMYCTFLQRLYIPSGVRDIQKEAFFYCRNIKELIINNDFISISENVFQGCINLQKVDFHNKIYYTRRIHDRMAWYSHTHKWNDFYTCLAIDNIQIYNGIIKGDKVYFLWKDNIIYQGYGKNLHEALDEYNFEVGHEQLTKELGELTPDSEINMSQYRLLTNDCKAGTEEFLISKNIPLNATMKISDIDALSEGRGRSYLLKKIMKKGSKKNEQEK